jgi:general secretion pathway protein E
MMSVATEQAVPESAAAVLTGPALDERICQFLVAKGRLKETDLVRGRRLHEEDPSGRLIAGLLTRLGASKDLPEAPPANVQLSVRFLKHHHVVPIGETESEVKLLIADPADHYPLEAIALATGRKVSLSVGLRSGDRRSDRALLRPGSLGDGLRSSKA